MSEKVKYLYVGENDMPDYVLVGSIARSRADDMVRYVPERTCTMFDNITGERADYGDTPEHIRNCNACHCSFGFVTYNEDGDVDMSQAPLYCPFCRAKVVS